MYPLLGKLWTSLEYSPEENPDDEEEKNSYLADTQHPLLLVLIKCHWMMLYIFYIESDFLKGL